MADNWVRPTSHNDPDGAWSNEANAYDGNIVTYASTPNHPDGIWTHFLEFSVASIKCNKLMFYAKNDDDMVGILINIDAYYGGAWHDVYSGTFTYDTYVEKSLGATYDVTKLRVNFYNDVTGDTFVYLKEVGFSTTPTVTTQAVSSITKDTATGNGNITALGGENSTRRGFCYKAGTSGDPTTADSTAYDDGDYGVGAFTKGLTSLSNYTSYRVRAYATNSIGTSYGTTVQMKTLATIPTVTTQAVSSILSTTATGNGNITATGGVNATKRGVCYNTTGNPTVADSKVEATGSFGIGAFTSLMTGLSPGIKYYVKAYAYNSEGYAYGAEVDFTTDKVAPTVTTQAPTVVLATTVTANGNITALGGENSTVRGFQYGLTAVATWDAHDDGDFATGAFTKGLTSLTANTSYWIRAYATNSIGTGYGSWVQFQAAAVGVIPTGTKLYIGSDYSGYTYVQQGSETDDGDTYTAYFVISTDLTNKQGLAFYKRILDLHLYFNGYDGGTVTVEVKRDSETTWQSVGTITLNDDEDIIIEHLATDIRAKHFLFKLSATNYFAFLGCLFEYIRGEMR